MKFHKCQEVDKAIQSVLELSACKFCNNKEMILVDWDANLVEADKKWIVRLLWFCCSCFKSWVSPIFVNQIEVKDV